MTPTQQADKLYRKFLKIVSPNGGIWVKTIDVERAKKCAIECCDIAIVALYDFGDDNDQTQNMDGYLKWWEKVKQEIEKI